MKAILIDSEKCELREVEYDHSSKPGGTTLQALIGGYIESAWLWRNGDVLFVDEEGLLKPQSHFFRIMLRPDGQPLAGNGVIVGREAEDDSPEGFHTEPPTITIEALRPLVQFLTREQAAITKSTQQLHDEYVAAIAAGDVARTKQRLHELNARINRRDGKLPDDGMPH